MHGLSWHDVGGVPRGKEAMGYHEARTPRLPMSSASGEPGLPGEEPASNGRLDSWKEIASYLKRSIRSA
jgi:hypothetical protein